MLNLTQGINTNTPAIGVEKANIMANIMGPWGCTGNSHEASLYGLNGVLTDRSGSGSPSVKEVLSHVLSGYIGTGSDMHGSRHVG